MKLFFTRVFVIIFIVTAIWSCAGNSGSQETSEDASEQVNFDPANLKTIEIEVHGMTCSGCERTVQTAVGQLAGVKEVKASHTDSTAVVTFDKTKTSFAEMQAAINDKGYTAIDFEEVPR
ncbi:MAG: cation transporter [Bacteroidales bacterium]